MTVVANQSTPLAIVLIDPSTGLPYTAAGGGGGGGTIPNFPNLTSSQTIVSGNISLSYNASGGAITQAMPSVASLSSHDQQIIQLWKTDSSVNAITVTSTDGFLGLGNTQTLSAQGQSLTLKIDVPTSKYKVL